MESIWEKWPTVGRISTSESQRACEWAMKLIKSGVEFSIQTNNGYWDFMWNDAGRSEGFLR